MHLDIAGTAWDQDNRDYVGKGASGWGVRLLVELARGKPVPRVRPLRGVEWTSTSRASRS